MADYVLAGLAKRRAELAGEAGALRARLAAIAADVAHLDAVIRQFDPGCSIASIRPKRLRGPNVAGRGEMSRFVLGALREAEEPVPTPAIAARLMAERGMDGQGRGLAERITKRIVSTLRHQGRKGAVRSQPGPGRALLWEVAVQRCHFAYGLCNCPGQVQVERGEMANAERTRTVRAGLVSWGSL